MRTGNRRIVAVGAVLAGLLGAGQGTAAAAPPAGGSGLITTEGVAYASLPAPDADLFVFLSVFDRPGQEATAGVEVFGTDATHGSYECFEGPQIPASLDGLTGGHAEGSTTLLCGGETLPGDVVAHVAVDVDWKPSGRVDRSVVATPGTRCVTLNEQRAATVPGLVTVSIPALGIETAITEGFGDVRTLRSICATGRG